MQWTVEEMSLCKAIGLAIFGTAHSLAPHWIYNTMKEVNPLIDSETDSPGIVNLTTVHYSRENLKVGPAHQA